ncbi:MAG: ATP-binding protein [Planctomycetota bacterium]
MRIRSLTARFVVTLILSSALPFLIFGHFAQRGVEDRLRSQVVRVLLEDNAAALARQLDGILGQVERDASLMERAARRLLDDDDQERFENEIDLITGFHTDFQLVLVAQDHGDVIGSVDAVGVAGETTRQSRRALIPGSVADVDWFEAASREPRSIVWLDRHLSAFLQRNPERASMDPADYSFGVVLPTRSDSGRLGVVAVLVPWRRVQQSVDRLAARMREVGYPSARVHLVDADANILATSDRGRYRARVSAEEITARLVAPIGATAPAPESLEYTEDRGDRRIAGLARTATNGSHGFTWRAIVEAPERELFASTRRFGDLLTGLTILVTGVLLVWSLVASQAILRPVRALSAATRELASGDTSVRVAVRGADELADLATSFNSMARELEHSREQLRAAAREAAWAEMARQVAHEIKNPLTPMRMSAQLVQRARRDDDPRVPELTDRLARTVVEQTDQLARIASDFRQFAGNPEPRIEEFRADDLLADLADLLASQQPPGVHLELVRGGGTTSISGDRGDLRRALLNLAQNALLAVGDRGSVRISSAGADDGAVEFRIRDDGPGIPAEHRERLFQPYFTTRSSGTGLGLAITRRILEAHRGEVRLVTAEPGHTEFLVRLPASAPGREA